MQAESVPSIAAAMAGTRTDLCRAGTAGPDAAGLHLLDPNSWDAMLAEQRQSAGTDQPSIHAVCATAASVVREPGTSVRRLERGVFAPDRQRHAQHCADQTFRPGQPFFRERRAAWHGVEASSSGRRRTTVSPDASADRETACNNLLHGRTISPATTGTIT